MTTPLRVMVVDDHTLFRRGLRALLTSDGRFEIVAEAGDAAEAQQLAGRKRPQVMLLDNHLPGVRGVDAVPALLQAVPGLRIVMLTMSEDERDLADALRAGASGYLLKTADGDELAHAIERAARGESSVSPPMTAKLAAAFQLANASPAPEASPAPPASALDSLSAREREILELIAAGRSNKEIARELSVAETTVKIHVQHILRKLQLSSRVQAAVAAATWRSVP